MLTLIASKPIGGTLDPIGTYGYDEPSANISDLFSNLFSFLTFIAGLAFVVYFVIGALTWITAGDDAQKIEKARTQMTNAAIGLIVVVAAYAIIAIVSTVLGLDILDPSTIIETLVPSGGGGGAGGGGGGGGGAGGGIPI